MKIPYQFKMQNHTIKVEINNEKCEDREALGLADYNVNKIYLATKSQGVNVSKSIIEHSFCHELAHYLLNALGEKEKNEDEAYVDLLGGLLAQVLSTMKFKENEK
jgi:predicted SprT family Zn-dependent metalloprotease